ncbi:hypothetical protein [Oceanobacillus bengalensis]|uniref:Uncharacterized protein n=1 Tax=Oceanobacillus bengalensis TaxID=1435466 RepID=A0A494Z333_9BACI|nr:hypothetical protein [Oceanobacillus bengalensis]RKQ16847.1 hypothetical protein D8M05_06225 [Oceanobacillus bengalensis]
MNGEKEAWNLLNSSTKKSYRFSIIIPIIFAITVVTVVLGGVLLTDSAEEAYSFLYIGCAIGFSIMLIFYIINWFFCLSFLKEYKKIQINDEKLKRLLSFNKICCILFMIPITFLFGMFGFQKAKIFARGTYRKGTLDEILYKVFILR